MFSSLLCIQLFEIEQLSLSTQSSLPQRGHQKEAQIYTNARRHLVWTLRSNSCSLQFSLLCVLAWLAHKWLFLPWRVTKPFFLTVPRSESARTSFDFPLTGKLGEIGWFTFRNKLQPFLLRSTFSNAINVFAVFCDTRIPSRLPMATHLLRRFCHAAKIIAFVRRAITRHIIYLAIITR